MLEGIIISSFKVLHASLTIEVGHSDDNDKNSTLFECLSQTLLTASQHLRLVSR